jgi:hypothetical protein
MRKAFHHPGYLPAVAVIDGDVMQDAAETVRREHSCDRPVSGRERAAAVAQFFNQLIQRVRMMPSVENVGAISQLRMGGSALGGSMAGHRGVPPAIVGEHVSIRRRRVVMTSAVRCGQGSSNVTPRDRQQFAGWNPRSRLWW